MGIGKKILGESIEKLVLPTEVIPMMISLTIYSKIQSNQLIIQIMEQNKSDEQNSFQSSKNQIIQYSPGQRFIKFNQEIGFGAYKNVYRGYDNDSGRQIAWNSIKLNRLPPCHSSSPEQRKRLIQQISILKNIKHPNIINFIGTWINKPKNQIVFVTQMVSGGSLKKIKKPRLKIIKGWCKQILNGLNYLHTRQPSPIIHRDIKCQNIFINSNTNQLRIGDLGLALTMKNSYASSLLGTPQFMAPEIFQGKYQTSVDIYAFGMCLLQICTRQIPYKQCSNIAQVYKNLQKRIPPKNLLLIESQNLKKFIEKCIDRAQKRPKASELLQDEFLLSSDSDQDQKAVVLKELQNQKQLKQPELKKIYEQQQLQLFLNKNSSFNEKSFRECYFNYLVSLVDKKKYPFEEIVTSEKLNIIQKKQIEWLKNCQTEIKTQFLQKIGEQNVQVEKKKNIDFQYKVVDITIQQKIKSVKVNNAPIKKKSEDFITYDKKNIKEKKIQTQNTKQVLVTQKKYVKTDNNQQNIQNFIDQQFLNINELQNMHELIKFPISKQQSPFIIQVLQKMLQILLPKQKINHNGHFGSYTEQMVKLYQRNIGVCDDGIVSNQLWLRMVKDYLSKRVKKEKQNQLQQKYQQMQRKRKQKNEQSEHILNLMQNQFFQNFE